MTRAKDISKIVTDANLSGTLDVTGAFTSQGIDDNADATAITIDSSERVGIGTSSPNEKLTISSGAISFLGDISTPSIGAGLFRPANNTLAVVTGSTERMRIDSSGNLLVGKTNTTANVAGTEIEGSGTIVSTRDNNTNIFLNRMTSDGDLIEFRKDNATKGRIYMNGSGSEQMIGIGGGNCFLRFQNSDDTIRPSDNTGANSDNVTDLGASNARFDDIFATNGTIQTSDQQEKNTITDSDLGIDFIKRLTPKSYIFNGKTRTHYGLIAQDVETVLTDINKPASGFAGFIKTDISEEQDGSEYRYGLRYTEFVAPLIQAVKDQQATIDALTARITALENGE
jgi:hypothetical protein